MQQVGEIGGSDEEATSVAGIAAAWKRELPGVDVSSIHIVTPILRLTKRVREGRDRVLLEAGLDASTLDLLSVLRRSGAPYQLSTRQITERTLVSAGAISQRITRAEEGGLVQRSRGEYGKTVIVTLTKRGHALVENGAAAVLKSDAELLAGVDPGELAMLAELLGKLQRVGA
ncbi:DNA-binding MarR family transcriptional regulator [Arthrobacter pigmenti]|uniref:DNA-binding MarR family transcriptional regulator n=1 Tax=Arthrobacter pigmenti TaxID=271432 RepID=A0A846RYH0_9MICC|nr:MarR family transcriptional regulator [Arthrobacter pigmenti]NJC24016.1 DNA-binding MarR family transcriptional regulator [Arthrobacter pigmenti]